MCLWYRCLLSYSCRFQTNVDDKFDLFVWFLHQPVSLLNLWVSI